MGLTIHELEGNCSPLAHRLLGSFYDLAHDSVKRGGERRLYRQVVTQTVGEPGDAMLTFRRYGCWDDLFRFDRNATARSVPFCAALTAFPREALGTAGYHFLLSPLPLPPRGNEVSARFGHTQLCFPHIQCLLPSGSMTLKKDNESSSFILYKDFSMIR